MNTKRRQWRTIRNVFFACSCCGGSFLFIFCRSKRKLLALDTNWGGNFQMAVAESERKILWLRWHVKQPFSICVRMYQCQRVLAVRGQTHLGVDGRVARNQFTWLYTAQSESICPAKHCTEHWCILRFGGLSFASRERRQVSALNVLSDRIGERARDSGKEVSRVHCSLAP